MEIKDKKWHNSKLYSYFNNKDYVYFVHSYIAVPEDILSFTEYVNKCIAQHYKEIILWDVNFTHN